MSKHVVVIGAGVGGLAAAVRLSAAGYRVTVLEKNERPGGKLGLWDEAGFRFDTGPSLLTLPWVLEEVFAAAGERLQEHLEVGRIEPVCRYRFPDGSGFDASADLPTMVANLERFSPGSGEDFVAFLGHAARAWRGSRPTFLERELRGMSDFATGPAPWRDAAALLPWPTLAGLARRFFRDPRMRQFVGRYATYTGSSPYQAPATLAVVPFVEYAYGAWHVMGGMHGIATTLVDLARSRGASIEFGADVSRVIVEGERAAGVELARGGRMWADAVVANADAAHLYGDLLPRERDPRPAGLQPSLSGFVILLGLEGETREFAHHNVLFSRDYPAEFRSIFTEGLPARDPTIYVSVSAKSDPAAAPTGCEDAFILVNAPATGRADWEREAEEYADGVLERLAGGWVDLRPRVRLRRVLTPAFLESRYRAWRGGIYGTSSNGLRSAFLRPSNTSPALRGLYLASGSAHPGGGLPLVMLSGKLAAQAVQRDLPLT